MALGGGRGVARRRTVCLTVPSSGVAFEAEPGLMGPGALPSPQPRVLQIYVVDNCARDTSIQECWWGSKERNPSKFSLESVVNYYYY